MSALAVDARGLRFRYPPGRGESASFELTLESWSVARGARVAIHGPSGCGKSTLLNLVAGVLRPTAGRLVVEGADLGALDEGERRAHRIRHVGFVFQDFPLVEHLEAVENVLLPYRINPALRLDEEVRGRARDLLADLGLGGKLARRAPRLSVGERQRVAIARALITEPAILLADEPTAGLDAERAREVMGLLERAVEERGLTLLVVTHDASLLPRFSTTLDAATLEAGARS